RSAAALALLVWAGSATVFAQAAATPPAVAGPATAVALRVEGDVAKPLALTLDDLGRLPRRTVEAKDHEGRAVKVEGVALSDVLAAAGAPQGSSLRGPKLGECLLATARDGYRVVFALTELDPAFTDLTVIVADRRDGRPLDDQEGPLRLVVPHE